MSYTNTTAHYELPQYVADDKPTYLNDFNNTMEKIDTAMYNNSQAGSEAAAAATAAQNTANANAETISTLTETVNTNNTTATEGIAAVKAQADANEGSINTINSLIGKGAPTTQEKTIIGAINEIAAEIPTSATIDSALSTESENAVQNKVVTSAINANTASIASVERDVENALNEIEEVAGQVETTDGEGNTVKFQFGIDSDGNYGYKKAGADTVIPFKTGGNSVSIYTYSDLHSNTTTRPVMIDNTNGDFTTFTTAGIAGGDYISEATIILGYGSAGSISTTIQRLAANTAYNIDISASKGYYVGIQVTTSANRCNPTATLTFS